MLYWLITVFKLNYMRYWLEILMQLKHKVYLISACLYYKNIFNDRFNMI
jgi:hypothetical protein